MRVQVTKSFEWAPNGTHVRTVAVGEVLEGRGAEVALELKSGQRLGDVVRLPLLGEYLAAGYPGAEYEKFLITRTAEAKTKGATVEVRAPTAEEMGGADKLQELLERSAAAEAAEEAKAEKAAAELAEVERKKAAEAAAAPQETPAAPTPPAPTPPASPSGGKRRGR
jgi:hypothetical protein